MKLQKFIIATAMLLCAAGAYAKTEKVQIQGSVGKLSAQQGKENAFWIIMDYSDIVVHIFQTEYREFYRLEDLWADAVKKVYEDEE